MATAKIKAGNCGLMTTVTAEMNGTGSLKVDIDSECAHIRKMGDALPELEPWSQLSFRQGIPVVLEKGMEFCTHTSCPVPVGVLKAIEVAMGTALPDTAYIEVTAD